MRSNVAQGDFLELDDLSSEITVSADDSLIEIAEDDFLEVNDLAMLDLNAYRFGIQSMVIDKDFLGLNDILDHLHFINKDIDKLTNTLGCPNVINSGIPNDRLQNNISKLPQLISGELPLNSNMSLDYLQNLPNLHSDIGSFLWNFEEFHVQGLYIMVPRLVSPPI